MPIAKYTSEPPAPRYKTTAVAAKTADDPKSLCSTAVIKVSPPIRIKKGISLTFFSNSTARYKTPVNLIISAGCTVNMPRRSHRCAPPPETPNPGIKTAHTNKHTKKKSTPPPAPPPRKTPQRKKKTQKKKKKKKKEKPPRPPNIFFLFFFLGAVF